MWVAILGIFFGIAQFSHNVKAADVPAAFKCKNSLISDEWRKMVLNFHNEKRRLVSSGNQPYKGNIMPAAEVMNELAWDCNLEDKALEAAEACTAYAGNYGINEEKFKSNPCNATAKTASVLKSWWDEVRNVDLVNGNKYKDEIKHFGLMAYFESTIMACSYGKCKTNNGQTNLVCLYEKKAPAAGTALYDAGTMCNGCPNKCIAKLCQPDPINHIDDPMTCQDDEMTDDMATTAQNMHNYYRRIIATGWAKDKKSTYAPRASKMNTLEYDCTMYGQEAKQKLANCDWPVPDPTPGRGQNTYQFANNWEIPRQDALKQAISAWYNELQTSGGIGNDP